MGRRIDYSLMLSLSGVFVIIDASLNDYKSGIYSSVFFIILAIMRLTKVVSVFRKCSKQLRGKLFNANINRFTASVFLIGVYVAYFIEYIHNRP